MNAASVLLSIFVASSSISATIWTLSSLYESSNKELERELQGRIFTQDCRHPVLKPCKTLKKYQVNIIQGLPDRLFGYAHERHPDNKYARQDPVWIDRNRLTSSKKISPFRETKTLLCWTYEGLISYKYKVWPMPPTDIFEHLIYRVNLN